VVTRQAGEAALKAQQAARVSSVLGASFRIDAAPVQGIAAMAAHRSKVGREVPARFI
jgi:hypothetical protein